MSARVLALRPRSRRVPTVPSKRPLVGRVRLATLRRVREAWAKVHIGFGPDGKPTVEGDRRAAIGSALIALNRLAGVWDTPEGEALATACYRLAEIPGRYSAPLFRGPADVISLDEVRARRAAGAP